MITVIVATVITAVIALVGGGYLGYTYGRKVEAKVQLAIAAAQAKSRTVEAKAQSAVSGAQSVQK